MKPTEQKEEKSSNQTTSTKNHQHMPPKQLHKTPQTQLPCPPKYSVFFLSKSPTV